MADEHAIRKKPPKFRDTAGIDTDGIATSAFAETIKFPSKVFIPSPTARKEFAKLNFNRWSTDAIKGNRRVVI
jgi:hypothetical protein